MRVDAPCVCSKNVVDFTNLFKGELEMIQGIVESISKTSIVVSNAEGTTTLSGGVVPQVAPTLQLGNSINYDQVENPTKIVKTKDQSDASTASRAGSSSPAAPLPKKHNW